MSTHTQNQTFNGTNTEGERLSLPAAYLIKGDWLVYSELLFFEHPFAQTFAGHFTLISSNVAIIVQSKNSTLIL